jgi:hypothetical protein
MDIAQAPVQAEALRLLARQLTHLADQIDRGQAEYLDGQFEYSMDRDIEAVPFGSIVKGTRPGAGIVHLEANIRFRDGLQTY